MKSISQRRAIAPKLIKLLFRKGKIDVFILVCFPFVQSLPPQTSVEICVGCTDYSLSLSA